MSIFSKMWTTSVISILMLSNVLDRPAFGDSASSDNSMLSESSCLQVYSRTIKQARSSDWKISAQDKKILQQCILKFSPPLDPNIPLPKASQCLDTVKKLLDIGIENLRETDIPEKQLESFRRCDEVIQSFYIPAGSMLPTLKINDRIIVDKTAYRNSLQLLLWDICFS